MAHLSSLNTWEWKFGPTMWDKVQVLWEQIGNLVGTSCEYDGNTLGTREKQIPGNPRPHLKMSLPRSWCLKLVAKNVITYTPRSWWFVGFLLVVIGRFGKGWLYDDVVIWGYKMFTMCNRLYRLQFWDNVHVVGTLQNFIHKHTIHLENIQRNKKKDKGGVTRHAYTQSCISFGPHAWKDRVHLPHMGWPFAH